MKIFMILCCQKELLYLRKTGRCGSCHQKAGETEYTMEPTETFQGTEWDLLGCHKRVAKGEIRRCVEVGLE